MNIVNIGMVGDWGFGSGLTNYSDGYVKLKNDVSVLLIIGGERIVHHRRMGIGVTNDFDFCEERKKDGLEHATNGGVRIAQRLELRVRE